MQLSFSDESNNSNYKIISKELDIYSLTKQEIHQVSENNNFSSKSKHPCTVKIAGLGRRERTTCYDMIHENIRGPKLIVIPANEQFLKSFAIGKYEISQLDYKKYCIINNNCNAMDKDKKTLPLTNISIAEINKYLTWLTIRTGATYRVPTHDEWSYAASANGAQPKKQFNCRVKYNGRVIVGDDLVSVTSGKFNGWGMKNYLGNAQELVVDSNQTILAVGGHYEDPHSQCEIELTREHSGNADYKTGFRLVREM